MDTSPLPMQVADANSFIRKVLAANDVCEEEGAFCRQMLYGGRNANNMSMQGMVYLNPSTQVTLVSEQPELDVDRDHGLSRQQFKIFNHRRHP